MKFNITVKQDTKELTYKEINAKDEKELRQWFEKSNIKGNIEFIEQTPNN
jgi:pectin methylesterase-like acyl-CoA thioesterase